MSAAPRLVNTYAAMEKSGELKPWQYTSRPLGDEDVEIKISHCGICGSDVHTLDSGWGPTVYPVVVGHEIVGEVTATGPKVTNMALGDRVGVGAQVWSCQNKEADKPCVDCADKMESYCDRAVLTYNTKYEDGALAYGGYADYVRHENVKPGDRVGVIGVGGLGHLAIQFIRALGAVPVAFSRSANKRQQILDLGAAEFYNLSDPEDAKTAVNSVNMLILTADAKGMPYNQYLGLLRKRGTLVMLGCRMTRLSSCPCSWWAAASAWLAALSAALKTSRHAQTRSGEERSSDHLELPMAKVNEGITIMREGRARMVAPSKHALVVGASSGIGFAVAKELAPIVAKLTLCSRSYPEELLKTIKADNPNLEVVHEKLDVSLMHEVRKFTTKHADTQFDWIVMSPGIMTLNGRTETSEGLDVKMATHYYGRCVICSLHFVMQANDNCCRFMLIHDLLKGLDHPGVRVLNILAAGHGGAMDMNDLDLKHTYSGKRCADATTQACSKRLLHARNAWIRQHCLSKGLPWFLRVPMKGLATVFGRSPAACGKIMVSALLNDDYATGWRLLDYNGKEASTTKYHTEEAKDAVWKHTVKTIDDIMKDFFWHRFAVAKELAPIVAKLTLCSRSYPEELLKTIQADNPNLEVVHEKLDVSLMHEVRKFTTKHADTQFDWIVMSPGIMTLNGRTETSEGLDVKMATHYYGRFMLIRDLLGRLICPGVRVLNVLGGGQGGYVDVDDLYLKRTYSLRRCAQATMQYSYVCRQTMSATEQIQSLISSLETDLGIEANAPIGNDKKPQQQKEQKPKAKKPKAPKPAKAPAADPNQPEITKLDIRVGKIVKVWKHETADKLYCEEIDVGEDEPRHIASGLVYHYSLEEMQDRRVLVLCNLKPRNLVGFRSHGMVMCAAVPLGTQGEGGLRHASRRRQNRRAYHV
ncbi:NAD(P)-binding domain [Phytophthora cactorum]|nr:NAD(P)-binding domain [Phytophthora cactorum]